MIQFHLQSDASEAWDKGHRSAASRSLPKPSAWARLFPVPPTLGLGALTGFKKGAIGSESLARGSRVNTEPLSLSLCQSNIRPGLTSLLWGGRSRSFQHEKEPVEAPSRSRQAAAVAANATGYGQSLQPLLMLNNCHPRWQKAASGDSQVPRPPLKAIKLDPDAVPQVLAPQRDAKPGKKDAGLIQMSPPTLACMTAGESYLFVASAVKSRQCSQQKTRTEAQQSSNLGM